jgi:histidyl-tRNA synthetase
MQLQTPRGTKDIYGEAAAEWQAVEALIRGVCARFGFCEIRTPIFESTELFVRGVGEGTDVVQKEMYTFLDKGGRSVTLRPEMTAGAARAFVEHNLQSQTMPQRLYYCGPNFRYEKPAGGRQRQFHQFGAELFGAADAAADAEMIALACEFLKDAGIEDAALLLNSLGGPECRAKANAALLEFLRLSYDSLCATCKERFEKNPMRTLDCKEESCQAVLKEAPAPLQFLGPECLAHFERLKSMLKEMGIPFQVAPKLVRGLDYYTRTVFEFVDPQSGLTVCGGGRYDNLVEEIGGPSVPAVGFAAGLERIMQMRARLGAGQGLLPKTEIFIGSIGDDGHIKGQALANDLRRRGIFAKSDLARRGVKAQLKYAVKIGALFTLIVGDQEIEANAGSVKRMSDGSQETVLFKELDSWLKARLK